MAYEKTLPWLYREKKSDAPLTRAEIEHVGKALHALQRGLTGERRLAGSLYMQKRDSLFAYLMYYFPITYEQVKIALKTLKTGWEALKKSEVPVFLLDVGSGPGPAAAALCDALVEKGIAAERIHLTLLDSSAEALCLAREYLKKEHPALSLQTKVVNFERWDEKAISDTYDFIVASHVVNELWKERADAVACRVTWLSAVCGHLKKGGRFLLSEPALTVTSRDAIAVCEGLLKEGFSVLSPCPAALNVTGACPALQTEGATCHTTVALPLPAFLQAISRVAGLTREAVKMTYFLFEKGLKVLESDATFCVVSDAMLNKSGRVRYLLCDGEKRIAFSAKKDDPVAAREGFFTLSRMDRVAISSPEIRGDGESPALGVGSRTTLAIKRFSPKQVSSPVFLQAKSLSRKKHR